MKLDVIDLNGKNIGTVEGDPKVFEEKKRPEALYQTLKWFLNSKRAGTHSTLTRSEVRGGGKKPWKQKGTGRARAGSIRSPLWRGGAVIFGPKPRNYGFSLPKKIRKLALRSALSDRAKSGALVVIDSIMLEKPKTSQMIGVLKNLNVQNTKALFVMDMVLENLKLASRNIKGLKIVKDAELNIFDVLDSKKIFITKKSVENLKEILK